MNNNLPYTWSLKEKNWETYTWSVKAFKTFKKELQRKYFEVFNRSLKEDFPNKLQREVLYKKILWFNHIDIFENWNSSISVIIDEFQYQNVLKVLEIINKK